MTGPTRASINTGPWIDWTKSPVTGATITLTDRSSAFLLAFLALYVGITGGYFWSITSFFLHQLRATKHPRCDDAMFHQQQVILKNTSSPTDVAVELIKSSFAWRTTSGHSFLRILTLLLWAVLISVGFFVAGIFSSEVTSAASNDMLIQSPQCGLSTYDSQNLESIFTNVDRLLNESWTAGEYVKTCYGTHQSPFGCNSFVTQQIPWKANQNATCPFAPGTCIYGDTAALQMDTGPLDSNYVFGLNAPKSKSIKYRKVTTCAPVSTSGYAKLVNASALLNGSEVEIPVWRYYYGPSMMGSSFSGGWTYQYSLHEYIDGVGYALRSLIDGVTWEPSEQFARTNGNVTFLFLAQNSVSYLNKVDDPWFVAHEAYLNDIQGIAGYTYTEDCPITVLGCVDQHQFCNPNIPGYDGERTGCTSLGSVPQIYDEMGALELNDFQETIAAHLMWPLLFSNMFFSVSGRGASALRANSKVYELVSYGLPETQWMTEVSEWFALILARIQGSFVDYATGPGPLGPGETLIPIDTKSEKAVCRSQKVPARAGFQNFSVLGIAIIIGLGTLIIVLGFFVDTICGALQTRFKKGEYGRLSWALDDKLQLQRMAYEGAGWGRWKDCDASIPVTEGLLDVGPYENKSPGHPSISQGGTKKGVLGSHP